MSVEQSSSTSAQEAVDFNVADELAAILGVSSNNITSYTAQTRRDYNGKLGTVTPATASYDGALQVQIFFRSEDGAEKDTLIQIDSERRGGLSEEAIGFFGGIAATAPTVDCISFVDKKL